MDGTPGRRRGAGTRRGLSRHRREQRIQGQVRVVEITHGEITHGEACGWHPHYHVLFVHDTPLSPEMARRFGEEMFDVWVSYCTNAA